MGKVNIKVSKDKLLGALKDKLSEVENTQEKYLQDKKSFEEAEKDYLETAKEIVLKTPALITEVNKYRHWTSDTKIRLNIEAIIPFNLLPSVPKEPDRPFNSRGHGRNYVSGDYEDIVAELTNAVRLLELSDEDVVSTATYDSVSRYL